MGDFIRLNGVYVAFWTGVVVLGLVGVYWALRLADRHERRWRGESR